MARDAREIILRRIAQEFCATCGNTLAATKIHDVRTSPIACRCGVRHFGWELACPSCGAVMVFDVHGETATARTPLKTVWRRPPR